MPEVPPDVHSKQDCTRHPPGASGDAAESRAPTPQARLRGEHVIEAPHTTLGHAQAWQMPANRCSMGLLTLLRSHPVRRSSVFVIRLLELESDTACSVEPIRIDSLEQELCEKWL